MLSRPRVLERSFLPVAFLGAGSMAQALIQGLIQGGLASPAHIRVNNKSDRHRLESVARAHGVQAHADKRSALAGARTVIVATKPKDVAECLAQARVALEWLDRSGPDARTKVLRVTHPLFISVAAGVSTRALEDLLPEGTPVVRAMPNTSSSVGESATAVAAGRFATAGHMAFAGRMFGAVGMVTELDERMMDVITGLSGSGPAYVYLMLEAMTEAGARLGLDREVAYRLALQTVRGAALTAQATGEDPAELRRRVTSPGGTTMAGLAALEEAGFKQGLIEAVRRAAERAAELGK
ncbi:MAG: pyrroline-5-carboxylate reductase [Bacillota bacterium]|nr:MAG: pyrroline-5-carboxylate reductase [Bacillota bacterium]